MRRQAATLRCVGDAEGLAHLVDGVAAAAAFAGGGGEFAGGEADLLGDAGADHAGEADEEEAWVGAPEFRGFGGRGSLEGFGSRAFGQLHADFSQPLQHGDVSGGDVGRRVVWRDGVHGGASGLLF